MKKALGISLGFLTVPLVAYVTALVTEMETGTFVNGKVLLIMAVIAILAVVTLHLTVKLPNFIAGAIVVGVLLSPYAQFLAGKINVFVMDPPNLRASISVPEIRVEMGDLIFTNAGGEAIVALPSGGVKTLYPGKNIVNLGQLNLPAGSYQSGLIGMKNIEVDVIMDIAKEAEIVYGQLADVLAAVPADIPAEVKAMIPAKEEILKQIAEGVSQRVSRELIAPHLPPFVRIKSLTKTGESIKMVLSAQIEPIKIPASFPYPTGTGGPDVLLDITLNAIGLPTGINPIIKLPPGAPAIIIPNMAPDLGSLGLPEDFGMPVEAIEQIKAQIGAAIKNGEASLKIKN